LETAGNGNRFGGTNGALERKHKKPGKAKRRWKKRKNSSPSVNETELPRNIIERRGKSQGKKEREIENPPFAGLLGRGEMGDPNTKDNDGS